MRDTLAQLREALHNPQHSLHLVRIIFAAGCPWGVQVYVRSRKVGPILLPKGGETVDDLLHGDIESEAGA